MFVDTRGVGGWREAPWLSESAVDFALFIASWKEILKGLGVRGKGPQKWPGQRTENWQIFFGFRESLKLSSRIVSKRSDSKGPQQGTKTDICHRVLEKRKHERFQQKYLKNTLSGPRKMRSGIYWQHHSKLDVSKMSMFGMHLLGSISESK